MEKIIFSEEFCQPERLYPFNLIRQVQDIRIGMLTIREKWEKELQLPSFDRRLDNYKDHRGSVRLDASIAKGGCLLIHSNLLPSPALVEAVKELRPGECIVAEKAEPVIFYFTEQELKEGANPRISKTIRYKGKTSSVHRPWEIFQWAACEIEADFKRLTAGRRSQPVPEGSQLIGPFEQLFIEPGARLLNASFNTMGGPIYIGKNANLLEASLLRGPLAVLESAVIKMGARLYGGTVIGRHAVAGGEIKNSTIFDYSNKAHDGYLGDSVVGGWCNLGAGTSNSNLKK